MTGQLCSALALGVRPCSPLRGAAAAGDGRGGAWTALGEIRVCSVAAPLGALRAAAPSGSGSGWGASAAPSASAAAPEPVYKLMVATQRVISACEAGRSRTNSDAVVCR